MSDTTNSASRRLQIITLLQSKRAITVNEIAEYFGVSRRTVFRDMNMLGEMGIPITSDRDYGYALVKGYTIPPLMFSEKELSTLLVGIGFLKGQIDDGLASDARDVEAKIKSVLPDRLKNYMQSTSEKVILYPYKKAPISDIKEAHWYTLLSAINEAKSVEFTYFSNTEQKSSLREVDPYLLVYYVDHWDLTGYCKSSNSLRTFVLQRMSNVSIVDSSFVTRRGYSRDDLLNQNRDGNLDIEIHVHDSIVQHLYRSIPGPVSLLEPIGNNTTRIIFSFDNIRWINTWLLQFADKITVVSPEVAVQDRRSLLQSLLKTISE